VIRPSVFGSTALVLAAFSAFACAETRYLVQAGPGQLELFTKARPLEDALADPETDPRTRALLREVLQISEFANGAGLATKGNYEKYVDLDRSAVVYFLAGSRELSFEAKLWSFPIVGSFPYTGWFDYWEARAARERLQADGWDVYLRPVRAYSTGGWLNDPLLSTMLTGGDDAIRYLVNVVLHELTHSNFFIPDQATFNESLASFVGDQMADDYLVARFGAESEQVSLYRTDLEMSEARITVMAKAYKDLETLYASDQSKTEKRAKKRGILRTLRIDADLPYEPNNASLVGFKTYNSGQKELAALFVGCGRDWKRFFAVVKKLNQKSFPSPQLETLGPFLDGLAKAECPRVTLRK